MQPARAAASALPPGKQTRPSKTIQSKTVQIKDSELALQQFGIVLLASNQTKLIHYSQAQGLLVELSRSPSSDCTQKTLARGEVIRLF
jgi:hypothetical protein